MTDQLPFEDDLRNDAMAAFDGLVHGLRHASIRADAEDRSLAADELDEVRFRLIDLVTAALDGAGITDPFGRLEALNLMAETLHDNLAEVIGADEEDFDEAFDEDIEDSAIAILMPSLYGTIGGRVAMGSQSLALPHLRVSLRDQPDSRN